MSYVNIWVHVVWGTKNREPILDKTVRNDIFYHIRENAKSKGIHLDCINGYADHVHCLISISAKQDIASVIQLLKGESSFWVNNKTKLLKHRLEWCKDYYAASIGSSALGAVRTYIMNQEEHHRKKTFEEECVEFMRVYGFDRILE